MIHAIIYVCVSLLVAGLTATPGYADIYSWVDEDGVRIFSNRSAPSGSSVFIKVRDPTPEERAEMDREVLESMARENREIRDDLEARLRETNRRLQRALDEADTLAEDYEDRLRQADQRAEEAIKAADSVEQQIIVGQDSPRTYSGVYYVAPYHYPRHSYRHRFKHRYKPYRKRYSVHRNDHLRKIHRGVYRTPRHDRYSPRRIVENNHLSRKSFSRHPHRSNSRVYGNFGKHRSGVRKGHGRWVRGGIRRSWQ